MPLPFLIFFTFSKKNLQKFNKLKEKLSNFKPKSILNITFHHVHNETERT